ncbi:hypothetical protein Tco_0715383 [Tanacetum coccineum]
MIVEEKTQAPKRTKEQIQQEEASLAEAIRLQTLEEEETAKQVHLDALLAKRMEEEELTEQQKQKKKIDKECARERVVRRRLCKEDGRVSKLEKEGTWKITQLKRLSFEEVKEEFDKFGQGGGGLVESFVPINIEATKAQLKRYGKVLQIEISKKQRMMLKLFQDKEKQIFQQGERSIYQIIRANGADTVYMSFGAMLKDFIREDLIELDLKTMFGSPLNEDVIWSLPYRKQMIILEIFDKYCAVHCLTLEACNIYMLADRKYHLSKDVCQVMLKMKLLDGKMNEVCYKLLKMIEKQAGVKK